MSLNRQDVLLSIQRALLGHVATELRAVTVSWEDNLLHVIFIYDGKISKKNLELAELAIGEILIDFETSTHKMEIIRLDTSKKIECLQAFAYYRAE